MLRSLWVDGTTAVVKDKPISVRRMIFLRRLWRYLWRGDGGVLMMPSHAASRLGLGHGPGATTHDAAGGRDGDLEKAALTNGPAAAIARRLHMTRRRRRVVGRAIISLLLAIAGAYVLLTSPWWPTGMEDRLRALQQRFYPLRNAHTQVQQPAAEFGSVDGSKPMERFVGAKSTDSALPSVTADGGAPAKSSDKEGDVNRFGSTEFEEDLSDPPAGTRGQSALSHIFYQSLSGREPRERHAAALAAGGGGAKSGRFDTRRDAFYVVDGLAADELPFLYWACEAARRRPDGRPAVLVLGRATEHDGDIEEWRARNGFADSDGDGAAGAKKEAHRGRPDGDCPMAFVDGRVPASISRPMPYVRAVLSHLERFSPSVYFYGLNVRSPKPAYFVEAMRGVKDAAAIPMDPDDVEAHGWLSDIQPALLVEHTRIQIDLFVDARTQHRGLLDNLIRSLADLRSPLGIRPLLTLSFDARDERIVRRSLDYVLLGVKWPPDRIVLRNRYRADVYGHDLLNGWLPVHSRHYLLYIPGDAELSPFALHYLYATLIGYARKALEPQTPGGPPPASVWGYALGPRTPDATDEREGPDEPRPLSSKEARLIRSTDLSTPVLFDPAAYMDFHGYATAKLSVAGAVADDQSAPSPTTMPAADKDTPSTRELLKAWTEEVNARLLVPPRFADLDPADDAVQSFAIRVDGQEAMAPLDPPPEDDPSEDSELGEGDGQRDGEEAKRKVKFDADWLDALARRRQSRHALVTDVNWWKRAGGPSRAQPATKESAERALSATPQSRRSLVKAWLGGAKSESDGNEIPAENKSPEGEAS